MCVCVCLFVCLFLHGLVAFGVGGVGVLEYLEFRTWGGDRFGGEGFCNFGFKLPRGEEDSWSPGLGWDEKSVRV